MGSALNENMTPTIMMIEDEITRLRTFMMKSFFRFFVLCLALSYYEIHLDNKRPDKNNNKTPLRLRLLTRYMQETTFIFPHNLELELSRT